MTHETVKIGIIGAGLWGTNHALALTTHPRSTVLLICDRDEGRARTLAERFGCAWTTSLDQLASSDVDAVTIATPDHLHAEPTLAMLRAGKPCPRREAARHRVFLLCGVSGSDVAGFLMRPAPVRQLTVLFGLAAFADFGAAPVRTAN